MRTRTRHGFGLLEMAFVLAMLAGILSLLYLIFHQQSSGAKKLDAHQEALRGALFALEAISRDLRALVTVPPEEKRQYGDHRTPVRISPLGRQIAFLVPSVKRPTVREPEQECVPVTYALVEGRLRRTQGSGAKKAERDLPQVRLRDLRFRLLEPEHPDAGRRSPDGGYYVQVLIEAVDRLDRQVRTLPALVRLDYPSRQAELHGMETRLAYRATERLELATESTRVTREEAATVNALRELAKRFAAGKLTAKEFEKAVGEVMAKAAGRTTTALVGGTGVRVPNFAELSVQPVQEGEPITLTDGAGLDLAIAIAQKQREKLARRRAAPAQPDKPGAAWWVDASSEAIPGMDASLAGLMGSAGDTFGPLAGEDERKPATPGAAGALP